MEVATIITSNPEALVLFNNYIYSLPIIQFVGKDHDTAFFENVSNSKDTLYYHFIFNNTEEQFGYNYKEDEISFIKNFFNQKGIYMIDLSYRSELTLSQLFNGFKKYLTEADETLVQQVLISHPFDGIKVLSYDYNHIP